MKLPSRIGIIHLTLAAFVVAILVKTARVQITQGASLSKSARHQQSVARSIPAARGEIRDARGVILAQSRDKVTLAIAPVEVTDMPAVRRGMLHAKVPPEWIARVVRKPVAKWVAVPGHYLATDIARLSAMHGVHTTPIVERAYALSAGMRRIVGRVDVDGKPLDGVELSLDSILKGKAGFSRTVKVGKGSRVETPNAPATLALPGNTILLTINQELQEIAERALADAVANMGAEGGDIVVVDPADGAILAMASERVNMRNTAATALTEPYEPGSTLKPFIAATLLQHGKARETDTVRTFGGTLTINGRTITDEHKANQYSLSDVIRYSSNVGIVQFAERLTPREEYEALRDFGFGTQTGLPYPVEAAGTLREPSRWSKQSPNSLAMGYEIAVTPLQLTSAYVALANDGELLEPALIKEVRAPDGTVLYKHKRRVVRRVLSPDVARRVREMLLGVVEGGGTAKRADLGSFSLAGKTGTARRTVHGRYATAEYIPTFVGLFPGDHPQFVILVKLDNPKGAYMGGLTAAPVTKAVVEAALASRDASLNRRELAASRHDHPRDSIPAALGLTLVADAVRESTSVWRTDAQHLAVSLADDSARTIPYVVLLGAKPVAHGVVMAPREIPDVRSLSAREAVRVLHISGFRVQLEPGTTGETRPAAGTMAAAGSMVHLLAAP